AAGRSCRRGDVVRQRAGSATELASSGQCSSNPGSSGGQGLSQGGHAGVVWRVGDANLHTGAEAAARLRLGGALGGGAQGRRGEPATSAWGAEQEVATLAERVDGTELCPRL